MSAEAKGGTEAEKGEIFRVAGPVVTVSGIRPRMYDVVYVGQDSLMGEVIEIRGGKSIIQVYEDTSGIKPGEPVRNSGLPLAVELGPGLLTSIYDGIQRPLPLLKQEQGDFIMRGATANPLDRKKKWRFVPKAKKGQEVKGGQVLGQVQETRNSIHRVLLPPGLQGTLTDITEGEFTIEETIARVNTTEVRMAQKWPVRQPRPVTRKLMPDVPLLTGQRIFDTLFPVAKGGTAAIPGPFGSGKTVTQHQLSKWADAKIVVYIGCGERGNEMTEVLEEFPHLTDPTTGAPLMERTVLIANTSNMPVAAREASVYTGMTIAEYYRDMGIDVALMADSTSRWAEAMREISSRLEEMPGEEGYPAYLAAKLSAFYERSGRVVTLQGDEGSITTIGAVSPPGGDFSEPVTQNTLRIVKVFWALDAKLAQRRHFPAINWLTSYSLYGSTLDPWFEKNVAKDWTALRGWAMATLQREAELQEIVQLVGSDALPDDQQLTLEIARMLREFYLQQSAFHEVDTYSSLQKQYRYLQAIRRFSDLAQRALAKEIPVTTIAACESRGRLGKIKFEKNFDQELEATLKQMEGEFDHMKGE